MALRGLKGLLASEAAALEIRAVNYEALSQNLPTASMGKMDSRGATSCLLCTPNRKKSRTSTLRFILEVQSSPNPLSCE